MTGSNVMVEILFEGGGKKGFFSKSENPLDYFEGVIYETRPEFMASFLQGKRREPGEKERVRELGRISGIWNKHVKFNGKELINFDKDLPFLLEYEKAPLPSDANWREDIEYRRKGETPRAQNEKERMEVLQRKDRKLREKLGGKAH